MIALIATDPEKVQELVFSGGIALGGIDSGLFRFRIHNFRLLRNRRQKCRPGQVSAPSESGPNRLFCIVVGHAGVRVPVCAHFRWNSSSPLLWPW